MSQHVIGGLFFFSERFRVSHYVSLFIYLFRPISLFHAHALGRTLAVPLV